MSTFSCLGIPIRVRVFPGPGVPPNYGNYNLPRNTVYSMESPTRYVWTLLRHVGLRAVSMRVSMYFP